jgi:hypothetical protein
MSNNIMGHIIRGEMLIVCVEKLDVWLKLSWQNKISIISIR